jgi:hypothetical protein
VLAFSGLHAAAADRFRIQAGPCVLTGPARYRTQAEGLAGRAPALLDRLREDLGAGPAAPFTIALLPPRPIADDDLARLDASAPDWAAGFLRPGVRLGGVRVEEASRYPYGDLASVLAHEMAHQILFDATGGNLPRWFDEGVATREGRRWNVVDMLVYSSALLTGGLPTLDEMDAAFSGDASEARTAYAASSDFVAWIVKERGEDAVRAILAGARRAPFPDAWREATGLPLARAEDLWRRGSLLRYRWIPAITGTGTLWLAITALALLAGARRRARSRRIAESWEAEDGWTAAAGLGEFPAGPDDPEPPETVH